MILKPAFENNEVSSSITMGSSMNNIDDDSSLASRSLDRVEQNLHEKNHQKNKGVIAILDDTTTTRDQPNKNLDSSSAIDKEEAFEGEFFGPLFIATSKNNKEEEEAKSSGLSTVDFALEEEEPRPLLLLLELHIGETPPSAAPKAAVLPRRRYNARRRQRKHKNVSPFHRCDKINYHQWE